MQSPATSGEFTVQSTITIEAPPERIWSVLVDLASYGEWNTFVPAVYSAFQVGSPLRMRVQVRKGLRVRTTTIITIIEQPYRMAWKTRMPRWLLYSERFQVLTQVEQNTTRYQNSETFTGILTPLLKFLLGKDLQRGFESVALNLKTRVETLRFS